jgi:exodeoxyribonuclease VII small subunit
MAKNSENKTVTLDNLLSSKDPKSLIESLDFESALVLLEQLVAGVEKGQLTLDSSIESYEKGNALVEHLRSILNKAEAKLKVVNS